MRTAIHDDDLRALVAQLPADGRLTLHLAVRETALSAMAASVDAPAWTIIVRDNTRLPLPGSEMRYLYRVSAATDLTRLDDMAAVAGLCALDALGDPACRLTWSELLQALDQLSMRCPSWPIEAIESTLEPEPRYNVTVRSAAGTLCPLSSAAAVDRLCLASGPLGAGTLRTSGSALVVETPTAASSHEQEPIIAWVFRPAQPPRPYTLGGLMSLTLPSSVCIWVDLCAPRRQMLLAAARQLGLPYQAALAALSPAGPDCHAYQEHIGLCLPMARRDLTSEQIAIDGLTLIVGQNVVLSVHNRALPSVARIHHRIAQGRDHGDVTAPLLLQSLLDEGLASHEALVRWMAHDSAARHEELHADQAASLAGDLQQVIVQQQALLAEAVYLTHQRHGRVLLPAWRALQRRQATLWAALEPGKTPAAGAERRVSRTGSEHRDGAVCGAAVLAGLFAVAAHYLPLRPMLLIAGAVLLVGIAVLAILATRRFRTASEKVTMKEDRP